jgi:hypothetical protein
LEYDERCSSVLSIAAMLPALKLIWFPQGQRPYLWQGGVLIVHNPALGRQAALFFRWPTVQKEGLS